MKDETKCPVPGCDEEKDPESRVCDACFNLGARYVEDGEVLYFDEEWDDTCDCGIEKTIHHFDRD